VIDGKETHEIRAKSEPVDIQVSMDVDGSSEDGRVLRDLIEFGLPGSFSVKSMQMTGSPLLDRLHSEKPSTNSLSITAVGRRQGLFRIYPGERHSPLSPSLTTLVEVFSGSAGIAISNRQLESLFDLVLKLNKDALGTAQANLGLRLAVLRTKPLKTFGELGGMLEWAHAAIRDDGMHAEYHFAGRRGKFTSRPDESGIFSSFARLLVIIGRLHLIAKHLNSDFSLESDFEISSQEAADNDLAYDLLRGRTLKMHADPFEISLNSPSPPTNSGEVLIRTTLKIKVGGRPVGDLPVRIDLPNFLIENQDDGRTMLDGGADGVFWISYEDHDSLDIGLEHRQV